MYTKKAFLLIAVLLTLGLVACASGPEQAAKEFIEASMGGDGATALQLTCDQYKEQVQMSGFLTAGLGMLVGVDPQSAEADLSDLNFETVSESGDTATVNVNGEVMMSFLGAAMPQVIDSNLTMVKEDGEWKYCGG